MRAEYQVGDCVVVEAVGARTKIKSIFSRQAKSDRARVSYDVGLGRLFESKELRPLRDDER